MSRPLAPVTPAAFLWLRLAGESCGERAHAVYVRSAEVACGIGEILPGQFSVEELAARADAADALPRCDGCRLGVLALTAGTRRPGASGPWRPD